MGRLLFEIRKQYRRTALEDHVSRDQEVAACDYAKEEGQEYRAMFVEVSENIRRQMGILVV